MIATTTITSEILSRDQLTAAQTDGMYQLLTEHFNGVSREQFTRDLAEKNRVILLSREDRLVGFSTMLAYSTSFEGEAINVIYSGDTIVAPEAWGTTALPRAWVTAADELRAALPPVVCYWMLLTSGFRTYRFLPVFWREFFPRFDLATPPDWLRLLQQIARKRFGDQFDDQRGIVHFHHPQRLRDGLNQIATGRTDDPHVAFFLAHNPGHTNGDELVCITEFSRDNMTAAGRRMAKPCASQSDHC